MSVRTQATAHCTHSCPPMMSCPLFEVMSTQVSNMFPIFWTIAALLRAAGSSVTEHQQTITHFARNVNSPAGCEGNLKKNVFVDEDKRITTTSAERACPLIPLLLWRRIRRILGRWYAKCVTFCSSCKYTVSPREHVFPPFYYAAIL